MTVHPNLVRATVVQAAPVAFQCERTFDFDVVGYYARPDIFHLHVHEQPQPVVSWSEQQVR